MLGLDMNKLSLIPITKFPVLIISSPRCGSGALGHALQSLNPDAVYFNEPNFENAETMQKFLNYTKWHKNYILKILASSIPSFPKDLQKQFFDGTFFTIKLQRANIIAQIASYYIARTRNKYHYFSNDINAYQANIIDIHIEGIKDSISRTQYDINLVDNLPSTDLNFIYEDIADQFTWQVPVVKTPYPTNYNEVVEAVSHQYMLSNIARTNHA